MATNPKIPPEGGSYRDERGRVAVTRPRANWWPLVLIIGAVAVIGALIWWLTTGPNRPSSPTTVTSRNAGVDVELTKLSATSPTLSGNMNLTGTIVNHGEAPITGVTLGATFQNIQGQDLETFTVYADPATSTEASPPGLPAGSARGATNPSQTHGFGNPGLSQNQTVANPGPAQAGAAKPDAFASNPIQPGQSRDFIIRFERIPEGWKGGVPRLRITNVATAK